MMDLHVLELGQMWRLLNTEGGGGAEDGSERGRETRDERNKVRKRERSERE